MAHGTPAADYRGGRRCAAGGCSMMKADGVSLHYFPFDRPAVLPQWIHFVQNSRRDWSGPFQVLCVAFNAFHRRCLASQVPDPRVYVKRKDLELDAGPTKDPSRTTSGNPSKRVSDSPTPVSSIPKKPRRAIIKRETQ
ncbi:uncharacterized protein [Panulirus ornatus]|uniref:uncharacterized protein n=1 Tax=Panulirus ornatus TaxID=150431 RepID=UPI003A885BCD